MRNILLVEDDINQRQILKEMLYEIDAKLNIYEASDKDEALDILENIFIDLFFLDISLKNSSGLDLALQLRQMPKYEFGWIIFITTHMEYITQAFKQVHCYDYILKPYSKEEVKNMAQRIIEYIKNNNFKENKDDKQDVVFELIKGIKVKIDIKDIIFIEVRLRTCTIHTTNGKYKIAGLTLKKALELIQYKEIVQCHKSFAVNINYISKIEKILVKAYEIYFKGYKETVPLSYKFKNKVMNIFNLTN
ncbi:LytR/AlgR family response regulator transcription factor [Clostridium sp. ZS2-4]|uniref:LytR/AlgR family response regulator transcription factor n=1 Tax=Clostridium sp. ZS2-4 TaxID=2987703 RepID=UPI00227BF8CA|nr:LytTR family DNA-binding domain-containing protein [Clostridium sp. ZS2-4]MCY6354451.1 LytTR family DNA-binding domain-containing protein [Clostridium sp. ZS2-4]